MELAGPQPCAVGMLSWRILLRGMRICFKISAMPLHSATLSVHIADSSFDLTMSGSSKNMIFVCCVCDHNILAQ